jgi:hypothetical protein
VSAASEIFTVTLQQLKAQIDLEEEQLLARQTMKQ